MRTTDQDTLVRCRPTRLNPVLRHASRTALVHGTIPARADPSLFQVASAGPAMSNRRGASADSQGIMHWLESGTYPTRTGNGTVVRPAILSAPAGIRTTP
jgi:hypothetical protein